jgi:hypothetical protein
MLLKHEIIIFPLHDKNKKTGCGFNSNIEDTSLDYYQPRTDPQENEITVIMNGNTDLIIMEELIKAMRGFKIRRQLELMV